MDAWQQETAAQGGYAITLKEAAEIGRVWWAELSATRNSLKPDGRSE